MQPSPSASEHTPSTKAALDHLQLLIEHLIRENRHLTLSLQHTRAQLDDVRASLNRFKLQVAESERNDHVIRKQIRTMASLIQRHRDASSPPSSPEPRPTPPPSPVSKSSPSPNPPLRPVHPTDVPNTSHHASVSRTPAIRDTPPSPDVNGNCSEIPAAPHSDTGSQTDSPTRCVGNEPQTQPTCLLNTRDVTSSSLSSPKQSPAEKGSSPSTSVSDALQKAFVAMEKDTTNAVHVLHDTKPTASLETVTGGKCPVEKIPHLSLVKETSRDITPHDANGIQGDCLQNNLNKQPGSSRKRSLKTMKRKAAGTSPASDSGVPVSAKHSSTKGMNGRLTRSLTQVQSTRSPPRGRNHLAKSVALKKTKKGYKVSLALSKKSKSSKSGDSSSDSSDDSDSSGPGCAATLSRPPGRPAKAQVSLEGGFPQLISAAHKLKDSLGRRKEDDGESDDSNENDSGLGATESEVNSSHEEIKNNGESAVGNGSFVPSAAIACNDGTQCAPGHFENSHEYFPYATGSPKLEGNIGEEKKRLQGAAMMSQELSNDGASLQHHGQSNPFVYGNTSHLQNTQYTSSIPRNPIPSSGRLTALGSDRSFGERTNGIHPNALATSSQVAVSATEASSRDSDQSLAAGKATENEHIEDSQNMTIHEITHVPVRPQSFVDDDKRSNATSSSSVRSSPGGTAEFLTIRSGSTAMLAWKARPGSKYVDASKGALAVKQSAAVSREDGKVVMNGKMRVLKPAGVTSNYQNHCYVSPMYPDGTFLPYVPVSGVVLHGKPVHWDSPQYADQSVQLSFSKEVFDTLVLHTRRAYRKRHPGAQVSFPGAFLAGHRVRKVVRIEPECSVNMTRLHRAPAKCSVAETLTAVKKDVVGLVLLYLSIESRTEDSLSVEVMFGLHSMVAHHLSAERRR